MRETFEGLVNPLEKQNNSPVGEAPHCRLTRVTGGHGSGPTVVQLEIFHQQKWVNVQNPWVYLHPRHLTPKSWFAKKTSCFLMFGLSSDSNPAMFCFARFKTSPRSWVLLGNSKRFFQVTSLRMMVSYHIHGTIVYLYTYIYLDFTIKKPTNCR